MLDAIIIAPPKYAVYKSPEVSKTYSRNLLYGVGVFSVETVERVRVGLCHIIGGAGTVYPGRGGRANRGQSGFRQGKKDEVNKKQSSSYPKHEQIT